MAEALCGPSNALQSFQKHSQVDRTLQQDRLASRRTSHENFRSSPLVPNPQADAEFEAFQRGLPASSTAQPFLAHASAPLQHSRPQPGVPAWASDFQQLSLHEARQSPIPAAHFRHEAPLQRSSPGPWHTEFMRQEKTATPPPMHVQSPVGGTFGQSPFMGMNSFSTMGHAGLGVSDRGVAAQNVRQVDQFDDAAFAAAFDNAAAMFEQPAQVHSGKGKEREDYKSAQTDQRSHEPEAFDLSKACVDPPEAFAFDYYEDLQSNELPISAQQTGPTHMETDYNSTPALEHLYDHPPAPTMYDIEQQDFIEKPEEAMKPDVEADELSRTAGQLLDHLKDEQSDKFTKSNFMTLMRQLRDKEVRVDGERFVETAQALHPGGPAYPHGTSTPKMSLTEDRYSTGDALV